MTSNIQDWEVVTLTGKRPCRQVGNGNQRVEIKEKVTDDMRMTTKRNNEIENETETFHLNTIPQSLAREIQQSRGQKKITQKDLAKQLCIPLNVIQELEMGRSIYNHETKKIIQKIERHLNTRFINK